MDPPAHGSAMVVSRANGLFILLHLSQSQVKELFHETGGKYGHRPQSPKRTED